LYRENSEKALDERANVEEKDVINRHHGKPLIASAERDRLDSAVILIKRGVEKKLSREKSPERSRMAEKLGPLGRSPSHGGVTTNRKEIHQGGAPTRKLFASYHRGQSAASIRAIHRQLGG